MSSSSSHNSRPMSGSQSFQASQSYYASASASRPFLNMLNPMSRQYQGYTPANQSVLEEDEENRGISESDDEDLEAGRNKNQGDADTPMANLSKSQGKRRVSWDPKASNVVHPNIKREDKAEDSESDGEVPQSYMIEEPTARKPSRTSFKDKNKESSNRRQPLYSTAGRKVPPILPTHTAPPLSVPPRPSEVDGEHTPRAETFNEVPGRERPRRTDGLDAYERALWNWVNVYNLDAFLQEVYYYYEGKGIYSIALSRGLNLLLVFLALSFQLKLMVLQNGWLRYWVLDFFTRMHRLLADTSRSTHEII